MSYEQGHFSWKLRLFSGTQTLSLETQTFSLGTQTFSLGTQTWTDMDRQQKAKLSTLGMALLFRLS